MVQLLKDPIIQAGTCGWTTQASASDTEALKAAVNTDSRYCMVGNRSLKLESTLTDGYISWRQDVKAEPGKTYTFSMYVKVSSMNGVGTNGGFRLRIRYQNSAGTWKNADSEKLTSATYGFVRLKSTFTMPADSASETIRCYLLLYNASGTVYGDMAQLEEGSTASRCNLIDNGDFVKELSGFSKTGSPTDGLVTAGETIYKRLRYLQVVNSSSAPVYASPSTSSTVLETLSKGARVTARTYYVAEAEDGTTTNWYEVDTTSGKRGYILSGSLRVYVSGADTMTSAVCAGNGVNLRKSASVSSEIVVSGVPLWNTMCIRSSAKDENEENWYLVSLQMNGSRYTGYMKSDYVLRLCKNDPYGTLPAASSLYASPSLTSTVSGTLAEDAVVHVRGVLIKGDGTKWYGIQQGSGFVYLPSADITFHVSPNVNKRNTVTVPEAVPGLNARILCFRGDALTDKKLSKTLDLTGLAGDTYMVNAWGYGAPLPFSSEDRKFGVEVTFVHTDGTTSVKQASFSPDLNEWQFLSEVFVAEKAYQSIKVAYVYCRNANLVFMDGLSLYREEFGQSYTYDADNNLISAVDNQKQRTEFAYDSSQDMTGVTDTKGNCFTYEYDDRHNVTKGTSAQGMIYQMTYDTYGNIVRSGPKKASGSSVGLWMKRTMDETLHTYVTEVTDTYGNTVSYHWDTQKDLLTSVEDGKGNVLSYGYDRADRLTSVSQQVKAYGEAVASTVTNTYEYDKDRLTRIGHNGFHYQFFQDAFGNTSRVSIAGNDVISHTYEDHNGKPLKVIYGNGAQLRYEYDKEERVEAVCYQESSTASEQLYQSFVYGKDGSLDQVTDHLSGKTYHLDYDFLDRLMRVRDESGNYYEYTYDSENLMVHLVHGTVDGRNVSVYTYDKDGREIRTRMGTRIRTTEYDTLGRVKNRTWGLTSNPDAPAMGTSYTYPVVDTTHEGSLPDSMTTPLGTYAYTYDANGNITEIVFTDAQNANVKRERYQYDELNQLIREDSESQSRTFIYHYDTGGNLISVTEYAYTTGTPSQLLGTSTGSYQMQSTNASGEVWKDQMVSWTDGATGETCAMTCDAIGNMLTKGSRTFEWKLGRKLAKVMEGTLECSYDYDHTGNRVKKTVTEGGTTVTTVYRMAGDLLLSEKTGSETLWYEYDSGSNLISMKLNGTRYFYIRNVQNDIVGLTDPNGTVVVRYQYNAWGKLLSITGSLAGTIGVKNPFRYRGYYYDTEMGLYYLKSRFYDPGIGRFISADNLIVVDGQFSGINLYVYCKNNPVNYKDPTGHFLEKIMKLFKEVGNAINQLAPVYSTCGDVAASDGPLFAGDIIAGVGAAIVTVGAIGAGIYHWATKKREEPHVRTGELSVSITYQSQANYWTADLVKGQIVGGVPLTAYQASIHVARGKSIMCRNQMAAKYLIFVNGYVNAVGPERHKGGYWHYHPTRNHTGYPSIHIWYFN